MDIYTLIVLIALFVGVMAIIAMMELRRRSELSRFAQLHQRLADLTNALSQLRTAIETGAKNSSDATRTVSQELLVESKRTTEAVKDLQASMETFETGAKNSSDATRAISQELLVESKRTTKAVKDLQASMEASVNFTK